MAQQEQERLKSTEVLCHCVSVILVIWYGIFLSLRCVPRTDAMHFLLSAPCVCEAKADRQCNGTVLGSLPRYKATLGPLRPQVRLMCRSLLCRNSQRCAYWILRDWSLLSRKSIWKLLQPDAQLLQPGLR